jgi:DNA-binding response OmpR family regulator
MGSGRRVLVVDDTRDVAEMLGELIQMMGHDVRVAHDGATAIAEARRFAPDLVLLDVGLPDMSGYDVARELRAHAGGRAMTIVAVTGWGRAEDQARSAEAGIDLHVVKPITIETVNRLLAPGAPSPELRP